MEFQAFPVIPIAVTFLLTFALEEWVFIFMKAGFSDALSCWMLMPTHGYTCIAQLKSCPVPTKAHPGGRG